MPSRIIGSATRISPASWPRSTARAEAEPGNPGLIACWPAVPANLMAAACGLLARRGHAVRPVTVTLWDRERTRAGWTVGAPPQDAPGL